MPTETDRAVSGATAAEFVWTDRRTDRRTDARTDEHGHSQSTESHWLRLPFGSSKKKKIFFFVFSSWKFWEHGRVPPDQVTCMFAQATNNNKPEEA